MTEREISGEIRRKIEAIELVAIDIDGVLTDSGMYYGVQGEVMKRFSSRDGKAIELLQDCGIRVALITGEENGIIERRAEKLQIREVYMGIKDKVAKARLILDKYTFSWDQLLYIGDDWQDIALMRKCGFACCPADALPEVQQHADYICRRRGGEGVVGEIFALCAAVRADVAQLVRELCEPTELL